MANTETKKLTIASADYELITGFLKNNSGVLKDDHNAKIFSRIEGAEVIDDEDFPWEFIRLNTKVIIRDTIARLNYTYIVVMPEDADHRKCKVSLFSPIGSALFGQKQGSDIYWQTTKGKRFFTIMAISQFAK
jgi:transcription elongation GreA/GreB family factor